MNSAAAWSRQASWPTVRGGAVQAALARGRSAGAAAMLAAAALTALGPAEAAIFMARQQDRFVISSHALPRGAAGVLPDPAPDSMRARAVAAAERHGLDSALVLALIDVESNFNPLALSAAGAVGLMQVMPGTGKRFGVNDLWSVEGNLQAGCRYLVYLMTLFGGNLELVLAAYNAGEGAVLKHGRTIPPYEETRNYVPKVLQRWRAGVAGPSMPASLPRLAAGQARSTGETIAGRPPLAPAAHRAILRFLGPRVSP